MKTMSWRRRTAAAAVIGAAVTAMALPGTPAMAATTTPTYDTWVSDVAAVTTTAQTYVTQRTASATSGEKLAIVLDIDNTSLASYYKGGYPTPATPGTLALAKYAHSKGVSVFFVTARTDIIHLFTQYNLTNVGYTVDGLYDRSVVDLFADVAAFKTAQREEIEDDGYTIIENIGNNTTDLTGGYAEKTYKLPDYDGLLD